MIQNYIVDKLTLSDLKENGKVVIPNFQRGVVWTKQHRKEFIETVKSGDPFGVVLVSQEAPSDPYYLIDGLQRLSTLKAYMDNPLEFIDENDRFTDKKKLDKIFVKKYEVKGLQLPGTTKLEKEKRSFLKKLISLMKAEKSLPADRNLWPQISSQLGVTKGDFDVYDAFSEFYQSFRDNLKLPNIIIHAIVYQGPKERLPNVFETLNTSSVSLTKYEVFSSKWPVIKQIVNDEEIVQKVWSKYANLKKSSSFDVDVDIESIRNEGMTLFEFCFGFSELVCDTGKPYVFLFNKGKKTTDPTGFELLTLACGLSVNKADILWKDEYLGGSSGAFLVSLKEAMIDSISIVANALRKWAYDLNESPIKNSSAYQIYYMIISVFKHKYDLDIKNKAIVTRADDGWLSKFNKYAFKWYFYHQITNFWNQNRQVSDLKNLLDADDSNGFYCSNISEDSWNESLTSYLDATNPTCVTRTIPAEYKLFMNYLYRMLIDEDANRARFFEKKTDDGLTIEFDIEHIVPVNKFSKFDEDLPMSALGNLCYLGVKDNRSKRDSTIYEYAKDRPALTYDKEFIKMIDYPKREELAFADCPLDQFVTPYNKMIKDRQESMVTKFKALIIQY